MTTGLLERDAELDVLETALRRAGDRVRFGRADLRGGRHRQDQPGPRVRCGRSAPGPVLLGACDDLLTPRTLGPLRDAVRARRRPAGRRAGTRRPGRGALRACSPSWPARPGRPCWSSRTCTGPTTPPSTCCATSAAGSRDLPAVVVVTYRDEEVGRGAAAGARRARRPAGAPAARCPALPGRGRRGWPAAPRPRSAPLLRADRRATRSSSPRCWPPAAAADAVPAHGGRRRARPGRSGSTRPSRAALEQLARGARPGWSCRWPARCSATWACWPTRSGPGCWRCAPDAVAFRHELARRAVEAALPVGVRMRYNAARARRAAGRGRSGPRPASSTTPSRPGTTAAVVAHAPAAARERRPRPARTPRRSALRARSLRHRELLAAADGGGAAAGAAPWRCSPSTACPTRCGRRSRPAGAPRGARRPRPRSARC